MRRREMDETFASFSFPFPWSFHSQAQICRPTARAPPRSMPTAIRAGGAEHPPSLPKKKEKTPPVLLCFLESNQAIPSPSASLTARQHSMHGAIVPWYAVPCRGHREHPHRPHSPGLPPQKPPKSRRLPLLIDLGPCDGLPASCDPPPTHTHTPPTPAP